MSSTHASPVKNLIFLALLVLPVLLFMGWMIAINPIPAAIMGFGLIGVVFLLFMGDRIALWMTIMACFILVGPVQSFGHIQKIFWLSYLLGLYLFVKALLCWSDRKFRVREVFDKTGLFPTVAFVFLIAILIASTVIATPDPLQIILASRDYLWLWGFFALVIALKIPLQEQVKWFELLPWLVVIQAPVVIYQHFFLVGSTLYATHDAVTGLFGGNPEGGGASGAMGFFSLLMALYSIDRMRAGIMSFWGAMLIVASALVGIALAEVKYVALMVPLVAMAYFGVSKTLRSPKAISIILLFTLASPVILYGYSKLFVQVGAKGYDDFEQYFSLIIERNIDQDHIELKTGEMGRNAAIRFWYDENNFMTDPVAITIGHGAGSTRIGTVEGEVSRKYTFKIARSTLTVFLWEAGALGALVLVLLLVVLVVRSKSAVKNITKHDEGARSVLRLSSAVFLVSLITLPYNTDLIGTPQFQLLFVMCCAALYMSQHGQRRVNGVTNKYFYFMSGKNSNTVQI